MSSNNNTGKTNSGKNKFCIHGHFYQPPREDPHTGRVRTEPSAFPYDNWNEKIYDQCYRPNAELGNFGRISFDLGPTLASWLETAHPDIYRMIVEQENAVYAKYGFSNGMAQSYNHTILPLATRADKETQIRWGIMDFEHRFGHMPRGLWLPETAVDMETLQVARREGIEFTILAPWQAKTRKPVDVTRPYWVDLGAEQRIAAFFYDGDLSMKVSFMPEATVNADGFLYEEILPAFPAAGRTPRCRIIASDGELYGHHQPFREKFLEWLTTGALKKQPVDITFPALYLEEHQPKSYIQIRDNTSWSCHHGVKRWASECPCAEHGEWKRKMRRAFDLIAEYVDEAQQQALDPYRWNLQDFRNEYGYVLTGRETSLQLIRRLLGPDLPEEEETKLMMLMKAQYERQRMFTSCGWFFGDFERIEARNNLAYAAMAVLLLEKVTGNKNYYKRILHILNGVENETTGVRAGTFFAKTYNRDY